MSEIVESDSIAQQAEHTPEPWKVDRPTAAYVYVIGGVERHPEGGWGGLNVANMFGPAGGANARRIVAAINAVRDIPTDVLELVGGHDLPVIRIGCLALALEEIGEAVAGQMPDDQYAGIGETIGAAERPLADMLKRLADERGPLHVIKSDDGRPMLSRVPEPNATADDVVDDNPSPAALAAAERGPLTDRAFPHTDALPPLDLEPTDAAMADAMARTKNDLQL